MARSAEPEVAQAGRGAATLVTSEWENATAAAAAAAHSSPTLRFLLHLSHSDTIWLYEGDMYNHRHWVVEDRTAVEMVNESVRVERSCHTVTVTVTVAVRVALRLARQHYYENETATLRTTSCACMLR